MYIVYFKFQFLMRKGKEDKFLDIFSNKEGIFVYFLLYLCVLEGEVGGRK